MASSPATMGPPPLKYRPCPNNVDGLVSVEALRIIVESKACFVALSLALAYFLTASQHRLWSSSHLIKGFLFAVTQPVTRFLVGMFTMLLAMPFRNDLYLLWGILLLAGYEGVYTITGYGVSARRSDLAVHEFARAYNIVLVGLYVRYYSHASQFRHPIWALWALMVAKFLERIVRFKIAHARYGDGNTNLVAAYMKREHELGEGCNYLITGESKMESSGAGSKTYEEKFKPTETTTVTVADVFKCDGRLLESTDRGRELKDVCLSFALCKLLRRKFASVPVAGQERPKARKLVFEELLNKSEGVNVDADAERTFRVVRSELGFARDFIYTKYPILFCGGFPVVSAVLFAVTLAVSVWITTSAVRHYRVPSGSTAYVVRGKNLDLLITFVILGMVTGMEICEFFMHLFSDWTKVMVIAEYVRKPYLRRPCFLNNLLLLVCRGKIAEPIGDSLGQFNVLKATKKSCLPECIINMYYVARSFILLTDDKHFRVNKGKTLRPVPPAVKKAICQTLLQNKQELIDGHQRLKKTAELEDGATLSVPEYCKVTTDIEKIMLWHVATSKLEEDCPMPKGSDDYGSYRVATTLSRYCAYLVFYKPKLLPITNNSVRYMCKALLNEASSSKEIDGIVCTGKKLAGRLRNFVPEQDGPWKALAGLWCELIISMAPRGNISAHQKELGKGGEFITHLWALLYHAGIDDKFPPASSNGADTGAAGNDDHFSQGSEHSAVPHGSMV